MAITRREFFATLIPVLSIPAMLWWMFTGKREMNNSGNGRTITIAKNLPAGISFHQGIILVKESDNIKAFDGKCTHLGCRINKFEGNELVCRCHGSRFDLSGKAVTGPAIDPLKELIIKEDIINDKLIIQVS